MITADTTVCELLSRHPEVFPVLERHGMCADCKADPPAAPLHHFAGKHCGGDVQALIAELTAAIGGAPA
jgi:hypothetical protein